jgi:hypothetical protein
VLRGKAAEIGRQDGGIHLRDQTSSLTRRLVLPDQSRALAGGQIGKLRQHLRPQLRLHRGAVRQVQEAADLGFVHSSVPRTFTEHSNRIFKTSPFAPVLSTPASARNAPMSRPNTRA